MDQSPLVDEQIRAANRLLSEFEKFSPIELAFWLKESEDAQWELYIAPYAFNKEA